MTPVSQLQPGQFGKLAHLDPEREVDQRLMALGLLPGMTLKLVRRAPLGDPVAIEFGGQVISLRKAEAESLIVDVAADCPVQRPRGTP
ncbi:MAG: ferrous iron transport protein A [Verrucomicrobiota bacterium]